MNLPKTDDKDFQNPKSCSVISPEWLIARMRECLLCDHRPRALDYITGVVTVANQDKDGAENTVVKMVPGSKTIYKQVWV